MKNGTVKRIQRPNGNVLQKKRRPLEDRARKASLTTEEKAPAGVSEKSQIRGETIPAVKTLKDEKSP